jgi:SAM-dependent MidA family methyltransferase
MQWLRSRTGGSVILWGALLAVTLLAATHRGDLLNPGEIHHEIHVDASAVPFIEEFFPTFLQYQDLVLFHPTLGYYSSGRVSFTEDYRTFPDALSPYFGQMVAEHIFRMWEGMRKAGTLSRSEPFTIVEFGAGDGALAESILDYIDRRAASDSQGAWRQFATQTVYVCYDRSPTLSAAQRKRNARFGSRFAARQGDATDSTGAIPLESVKGIVLSNELPDAFSVHKVIFSMAGSVEVGFVAPVLPRSGWNKLEKDLPDPLKERLKKEDLLIQTQLFGHKHENEAYLSRSGFEALLEELARTNDYPAKVTALEFHEIYVPVEAVPAVAEHVRQYIPEYAYELAKSGKGFAAYLNLGEGKFIRAAGRLLKAGYVITMDYGSNWDGVSPLEFDHLRTYGPGSGDRANPYRAPTLNDITTDVNFGHMVEEGKVVGLRPVFFGPQHTLITGTPIALEAVPPQHRLTQADLDDYDGWVKNFYNWDVYKILIQQKEGTDPSYSFPDTRAEPWSVKTGDLDSAQQELEQEIERQLRLRLIH